MIGSRLPCVKPDEGPSIESRSIDSVDSPGSTRLAPIPKLLLLGATALVGTLRRGRSSWDFVALCWKALYCNSGSPTLPEDRPRPSTKERSRAASCDRIQLSMSFRCPVTGRAQRRFLKGFFSGPAHQYSLVTMRDQPWRPLRVSVNISIVRPCLGPAKLCRSRSNSTPSCVQCVRCKVGFEVLRTRSKTRKKDGAARLFILRSP